MFAIGRLHPRMAWSPSAAVAATALRPGKAHEALQFRLAVEVGHPLACQLSGQVIRQHPSLLLGCAGVVVWSDGRERTARGHHAKVDALVECCGGRADREWYGLNGRGARDPRQN